MSGYEKIEAIRKLADGGPEGLDQITAFQPVEEVAPNKERFDALMSIGAEDSKKVSPVVQPGELKPSPIEEIGRLNSRVEAGEKPSTRTLIAQTEELIHKIDSVKQELSSSPRVEIKSSVTDVLNNKLTHIDENLKLALSKAGVEYSPEVKATSERVNPIDRFLGFLTHGQSQLQNLSGELFNMSSQNQELSPAKMLGIQIKVGYIQQEVELFTSLLTKTLDSVKTVMNIQV